MILLLLLQFPSSPVAPHVFVIDKPLGGIVRSLLREASLYRERVAWFSKGALTSTMFFTPSRGIFAKVEECVEEKQRPRRTDRLKWGSRPRTLINRRSLTKTSTADGSYSFYLCCKESELSRAEFSSHYVMTLAYWTYPA
jgi:hypothetical protein